MNEWLIKQRSANLYWSMYGWSPYVERGMRFLAQRDAETAAQANKMIPEGTWETVKYAFDDERRPDVKTDYNPFAAP